MSMEFAPALARTSSYLDAMDTSFPLLDNSMEYLQYDQGPSSPGMDASLGFSGSSTSPSLDFHTLNLAPGFTDAFTYGSAAYHTDSPPRSYTPSGQNSVISPPSLSFNLSAGGDIDSDESGASGRVSRPKSPGPAVPYAATIPRSAHRFNPIAIPATRASTRTAHKRRDSKSSNDLAPMSDDEEEDQQSSGGLDPRREMIRQQRINSEQRRRDDLREGYTRLRNVLPPSSAKSSKVNILDRSVRVIKGLELEKQELTTRVRAVEQELARLRQINEILSLRAVQKDAMLSVGQPSLQ